MTEQPPSGEALTLVFQLRDRWSTKNSHEAAREIDALSAVASEHQAEIAALKHDIERTLFIASSEAAGHSEALAKLARLQEPDDALVLAVGEALRQHIPGLTIEWAVKPAESAFTKIAEMLK